MKWAWAILAASFPFWFLSCTKSSTKERNILEGRWELQQQQAGIMPTVNYPTGNANSLVFKNTTYELVQSGRVIKKGTYAIMHDASVASEVCLVVAAGAFENRLVYDNDPSYKIYFQVAAGKLELLSGCFALDAGTYQSYVKQPATDVSGN